MDINEAIANVNAAFLESFGRALNDVETVLIRGTWENQTYGQIADTYGYSDAYLRCDIAQKLWKQLGIALGEPVTKKNFRSTVERRWQLQAKTSSQGFDPGETTIQLSVRLRDEPESLEPESLEPESLEPENDSHNNGGLENGDPRFGETIQDRTVKHPIQADWGEALDVGLFHGRTEEFAVLNRWVLQDRCRLVALLGLGGIGKTTLAAKFARQEQDRFDYVIWRSLRNAPALEHLLEELVLFLSDQQDREATLKQLVHWLTASRCLVVLDNIESILLPGERVGHYKAGYEGYGELLNIVGEASHQSCVLLTSREKPTEISMLEGTGLGVRAYQLRGSLEASIGVIRAKGLKGTDLEKRALCERYACIPLAIKIAAGSIGELFDGQIGPFLDEGECLFSGTQRLLDMQFGRLSPLQQTIMFWLAINRTYTSIPELAGDIVPSIKRARVLEALEALSGRSLVEKRAGHFTQQPVVMEFVTARLIELAVSEIESGELSLLIDLALLKATAVEFIRESQQHVIVEPIVSVFLAKLRNPEVVAQTFVRCLKNLRDRSLPVTGYGGGNILNLLHSLP
ncbi:MAG: NB-ARC domain-containing protein, partial [Cyanobacteria bacterium P01_E01_bin.48]